MASILINGNFLCRPLTGIERFAYETVSCMDSMIDDGDDIALFTPVNSTPQEYNHISTIKSKKPLTSFPAWDMVQFARKCALTNRVALSFSNTAPLGKKCGFAFIHDVYCADCPEDFSTLHEKAVALYTDFSCRNICKNALKVITVSNFSASRIIERYNVEKERIVVITNGYEHFNKVLPDDRVFSRFPRLIRGGYYFTLGSLQKRKNLAWVLSCAKSHPKDIFAISGGKVSGYIAKEVKELSSLKNIIMTGRLEDGEVKSMMQSCKAFLFPSLYEGFGIPPLEALSCGAPVIVSNIPVFHEIYKDSVHYIDPHESDIDIDAILKEKTKGIREVLNTHTYKNAARSLLNLTRQF